MEKESNMDTTGESSHPASDEYSDLIGAVVTQQMIQEEKFLEQKAIREEKEMKEQIMEQQRQELEEVCYKRLNLLLNRSSLYAKFMAEKLERDRLKESKKQKRAENKKLKSQVCEKKQHPKDTAVSSQKKRPRSKVEDEEEEEDDIENKDVYNIPSEKKRVSEGQPSLLTGGVMHPYQIEGFEWMKVIFENGVNGILADEMGLGKTIQTIAFVAHLIEMGVSGPFFVCAPLSTVPNWCAEFKRFAPSIPVILYHGTKEERYKLRSKIRQKIKNGPVVTFPVVITSYSMVLYDVKFLISPHWKLLVIDEAHRIKNYQCKLIANLKLFKTMHRLLLTGTPLQNDLCELWSLLNFILPEIFDDLKVFESWFDISRLAEDGGTDEIIAREQEKKIVSIIHEILSPFLLRRTKSEVQLKLPPKKEVIVHAPLTKLQQDYYTAVLNRTITLTLGLETPTNVSEKRKKCTDFSAIYKMLEDEDFDEIPDAIQEMHIPADVNAVLAEIKLNMRNTSMILRKICNHPYLLSFPLDPVTEDYKIDEDLIKTSGKFLVMDQILPELKKGNHKILLFSQFVCMLEILADYCRYRGYEYCRLQGSTSLDDREKNIKRFNESEDVLIFLISTKAGGLGLNLPAADTVIIFDSDWNPQGDIQAQDRCHRIGQTRPVVVYRLIIPNTVDEKIIKRATAKRKLEKVIIKKGRFNSGAPKKVDKLLIDELLELLQSSDLGGFVKTDDNNVLSPKELQKLLDRSDMV